MPSIRQIQQRRQQILEEVALLTEFRRGNLTVQMVETVGTDGRCRFRGPYPLYSFKVKGKTLSRRVTDPAQVALYRRQIQRGRRFQELAAQLLRCGEELSDHAVRAQSSK